MNVEDAHGRIDELEKQLAMLAGSVERLAAHSVTALAKLGAVQGRVWNVDRQEWDVIDITLLPQPQVAEEPAVDMVEIYEGTRDGAGTVD